MKPGILRAFSVLLAGLLVILPVTACTPESENPLPDETRVAVDERLVGTWVAEVLGNRHVAEVSRGDAGVLEVRLTSVTLDGAKRGLAPRESRHRLYFYELLGTRVIAEQGPSLVGGTPLYRFASYRFAENGTLTLTYAGERPIYDFVASLRMRGELRSDDPVFHDVIVQGPSEQLAAVMRRAEPAKLFTVPFGPFVRQ